MDLSCGKICVALQEEVQRMDSGAPYARLGRIIAMTYNMPPSPHRQIVAERRAPLTLALMDLTDCSLKAEEKPEFILCIPEMEARYKPFHHR